MRLTLGALLALTTSSQAAEPASTSLSAPITTIVADAETVLALGPEGGMVMAISTGERRPIDLAASEALLVDVDGLPGSELVTCGPSGLAVFSWPTRDPMAVRSDACKAVAVGLDGQGPVILAVGAKLAVLRLEQSGLRVLTSDEGPGGEPIVASGGDRFVIGSVGAEGLTERSAWGTSTIATGGPIGGVGFRDGLWMWSLPDQDLLAGQLREESLTGRGPGRVRVADLNGDGVDDVVVQHADRIGVVRDRVEEVIPWRAPVDAITVDGRPCPSIWVASADTLYEFPGECGVVASVRVVGDEPAAAIPAVASVPSGELDTILLDGRAIPEIHAVVGVPMRARLVDSGGRPMRYGARGGPQGMVVRSDGMIEYTPRAGQEGGYVVSVRMSAGMTVRSATVRLFVEPGAPVTVPAPTLVPAPTDAAASPATESTGGLDYRYIRRGRGSVDGCAVSAGGAVALSRTPMNTWEFAGRGPYTGSVSPALGLSCEGRGSGPRWFIRGSSAPTLFYTVPGGGLGQHILAGSLGFTVGSEAVRIGPYGTLGIVLAGAGVRSTIMPFKLRNGNRHGLELDLLAYLPSTPAASARLGWILTL